MKAGHKRQHRGPYLHGLRRAAAERRGRGEIALGLCDDAGRIKGGGLFVAGEGSAEPTSAASSLQGVAIPSGEAIFSEAPMVCTQTFASQEELAAAGCRESVCERCLRLVSSEDANAAAGGRGDCGGGGGGGGGVCCPSPGCDAVWCGPACRDLDKRVHERLLCRGGDDDGDDDGDGGGGGDGGCGDGGGGGGGCSSGRDMRLYWERAASLHNEWYILAAKIIAALLVRVEDRRVRLVDAVNLFGVASPDFVRDTLDLHAAGLPESAEAHFVKQTGEMADHLYSAIVRRAGRAGRAGQEGAAGTAATSRRSLIKLARTLTENHFFGRLVGVIRANCCSVVVVGGGGGGGGGGNSLRGAAYGDGDEGKRAEAGGSVQEAEVLVEGIGFFPLQSAMNHSCRPNVAVQWSLPPAAKDTQGHNASDEEQLDDEDSDEDSDEDGGADVPYVADHRDARVVIRALRDLRPGEELVFDYLTGSNILGGSGDSHSNCSAHSRSSTAAENTSVLDVVVGGGSSSSSSSAMSNQLLLQEKHRILLEQYGFVCRCQEDEEYG